MRRSSWITLVASRWFRPGSRAAPSLLPSAAGIAVGVAALVVIIGVMNGFQSGFIEAVLELDSYHLRVDPGREADDVDAARAAADLAQSLAALPGASVALPFADLRTLATNARGRVEGLRIKLLPADAEALDPAIAGLSWRSGGYGGGIALGSELARRLNAPAGTELKVLLVTADEESGIESAMIPVRVSGVFHTGFYDFDAGLALWSFDEATQAGLVESPQVGVKLKDRYDDARFSAQAAAVLPEGAEFESWRHYNRAFFGALRMEKNVMMSLVGLIFIVVGVNIFHSMRKAVYERMEEVAILKALGGRPAAVQAVFVLNGAAAGLGGAAVGLAAGSAIALNVNAVFGFIEQAAGLAASLFGGDGIRFFSPELFYLTDVPVRLWPAELAFIGLAGALSALIAAFAASARVGSFTPAEVLRNE
jgi:lipoprotein-releasing system permease protein